MDAHAPFSVPVTAARVSHTLVLRNRTLGATHPTRALAHRWHASQLTHLAPSRLFAFCQWHTAACRALALERADDRYLLTSGSDPAIALWDSKPAVDDLTARTSSGRIRPIGHIDSEASHSSCVSSLAWYPGDTGMFVSGSLDHTIRVWDTNHLEEAASFDLGSEIHAISISSGAIVAAAAQEPNVRLCDLRTGANVQALRGHTGEVRSVAWFPEHEWMLASGSTDGTLRVWDTRRARAQLTVMQAGDRSRVGTSQAMLGAVTGIAVAPDGSYAVVMLGTSGRTQVWDLHGQSLMAGTRTHHASPLCTPPALLHTSVTAASPPGYFVPSGQDLLFADLHETSSPRLPLAFASLSSSSSTPGRLIGSSHARTRRVGSTLAPLTAVAYSARRMSVFTADEAGGVMAWDTSAAAASGSAGGGKRKRDGEQDEVDDILVRHPWEVAEYDRDERGAGKRSRQDDWSDDDDDDM